MYDSGLQSGISFSLQEKLMPELSIKQKKDYAKTLYLSDLSITQKEIATRAQVSEKTVSNWVNNDGWDKLRESLLTTRGTQLANLYAQLTAINLKIAQRQDGERYATNKEADVISKLTSAIQKLELELSISDKFNVVKDFLDWLRPADLVKAKELSGLFDAYIKDSVR